MPKDQFKKDPGSLDDQTFAVHVRRARSGSWWTVDVDGEIISQWPSEFAAIDAGRVNARRFALLLVIHDGYGSRTESVGVDEE
jgi:hypothetical protein